MDEGLWIQVQNKTRGIGGFQGVKHNETVAQISLRRPSGPGFALLRVGGLRNSASG